LRTSSYCAANVAADGRSQPLEQRGETVFHATACFKDFGVTELFRAEACREIGDA
jgi:hypothetical protein